MGRFVSIPPVDLEGLPDGLALSLSAMKENVELLAGIRSARSAGLRAIRKEEINLQGLPISSGRAIGTKNMTVQGQGYKINDAEVPALTDFVRLINDVVECKQDIAALVAEITEVRRVLSLLVEQLRN